VYQIGEHEGRLFIALELVEGETLEQLIARGDLKTPKAVHIVTQISEGLAAAHEAGIVHRDIKPANVLMDKSGRVKILDFGLAKSRRATTETKVGTTVGTIQYESPEQGRGDAVDQRSDLFSLGVVLYEMVTGRRPFVGEFTDAIRYAIANDTPEPLARFKADVPDDLQRIVSKLLEKDSDLRYQTAGGLLSDLKLLQRSSGPTPSSVHSAVRPPLAVPPKKSRRFVIPAMVVVIAAALLLVFKPWRIDIKPTSEATAGDDRIAVMYFDNLGDREDTKRLGEIVANLLISDLSGAQYVQVVSSQRLYDLLKQLGREGERTIAADMATQVAQKANAKWMVTGSIMQSEPTFVLSAQLVEVAGGNVLAAPTIEGAAGESIYRVVDRLQAGLRKSLSLPTEALAESGAAAKEQASGSTDAYRLYLEGRDLGYQYRWAEAEVKFNEALKYDSTFAMAYLGLARARQFWWGDVAGARRAIVSAKAYIDRADERDRQLILARDARFNGRSAEAVTHLEALLTRYPDDKEAYMSLGDIYRNDAALQDLPRAIEMYRKVVELDPQFKEAYNLLAYSYDAQGDLEQSLWAINKYIEIAPNEPNPYDSRGDLYARNGQPDLALASFHKALDVNPQFTLTAYKVAGIMLLREDYAGAEKIMAPVIASDNPETRSRGRSMLVLCAIHRGQFKDAVRQLDSVIKLHEKEVGVDSRLSGLHLFRGYAHLLGRNYAAAVRDVREAKDIRGRVDTSAQSQLSTLDDEAYFESYLGHADRADSILDLMRAQIGTPAMPDSGTYSFVRALVALNLGKCDSVVTWIERAIGSDLPDFFALVTLGRGHMGSRRLRDAVTTLEHASDVYDGSRWDNADTDVRLHYWLAQAYEKSGRRSDAVEEYTTFLRIWRDADDGLPEIADAKARLAQLQT